MVITYEHHPAFIADTDNNILNPLSPHDAWKHHFTSPKTDLTFLRLGVLERKLGVTNRATWPFSWIFYPLQVIFIHYNLSIATEIRGL